MEENKNPLVEVHRLPGPQKRGTGATLILVGIETRNRGHRLHQMKLIDADFALGK
jgi:hypothetical protein